MVDKVFDISNVTENQESQPKGVKHKTETHCVLSAWTKDGWIRLPKYRQREQTNGIISNLKAFTQQTKQFLRVSETIY